MMMDRTTKFLLVAITVALWGLLLRPVIAPTPTLGQAPPAPAAIDKEGQRLYVLRDRTVEIYEVDESQPGDPIRLRRLGSDRLP